MALKTLGTKDVAQRIDRSEATVRRYADAGILPFIRLVPGGARRFRVEDVERLTGLDFGEPLRSSDPLTALLAAAGPIELSELSRIVL